MRSPVMSLADEVEALVAAMVETPWPTTPHEYGIWAEQVGLPVEGEADLDADKRMPEATHFQVPNHPWYLSRHYFRGEFAGVSFFPDDELCPHELLGLAQELRDRFDARWVPIVWIESEPPLTAFTCYWLPGECMVDFYWHAPQVGPFGDGTKGMVQLAVTHYTRSLAENKAASERGCNWLNLEGAF